jgi:hypothetical protein
VSRSWPGTGFKPTPLFRVSGALSYTLMKKLPSADKVTTMTDPYASGVRRRRLLSTLLEPTERTSPAGSGGVTSAANKLCQVISAGGVREGSPLTKVTPPRAPHQMPLTLTAPQICPSSGPVLPRNGAATTWRFRSCQLCTSNQDEHMARCRHPIGCHWEERPMRLHQGSLFTARSLAVPRGADRVDG